GGLAVFFALSAGVASDLSRGSLSTRHKRRVALGSSPRERRWLGLGRGRYHPVWPQASGLVNPFLRLTWRLALQRHGQAGRDEIDVVANLGQSLVGRAGQVTEGAGHGIVGHDALSHFIADQDDLGPPELDQSGAEFADMA